MLETVLEKLFRCQLLVLAVIAGCCAIVISWWLFDLSLFPYAVMFGVVACLIIQSYLLFSLKKDIKTTHAIGSRQVKLLTEQQSTWLQYDLNNLEQSLKQLNDLIQEAAVNLRGNLKKLDALTKQQKQGLNRIINNEDITVSNGSVSLNKVLAELIKAQDEFSKVKESGIQYLQFEDLTVQVLQDLSRTTERFKFGVVALNNLNISETELIADERINQTVNSIKLLVQDAIQDQKSQKVSQSSMNEGEVELF